MWNGGKIYYRTSKFTVDGHNINYTESLPKWGYPEIPVLGIEANREGFGI